MREETGIVLAPEDLVGPVALRSSVFDFFARHVRQDEEYFVARLDRAPGALDTAGWTEVERAFMDGISWLSREEIAAFDVEVFPVELPELLAWLSDGWDGTVRLLGDNAG